MRISDWSSDVCSSDLPSRERQACQVLQNRRICMIFGRVKSLDAILATAERKSLNRSLGAFQLTMLGIGAVIGTGIFVLTAEAAQKAGHGMMRSFTIAGAVCAVAALCYAEMAAMEIGRASCRERVCQYV